MKYKTAFRLYDLIWKFAIPFLRRHSRLAEGFEQRTIESNAPDAADIWIQAASVGESYLAWEILKHFRPDLPVTVHLTSNTRQGLDILTRAVDELSESSSVFNLSLSYFPLDRPKIMAAAVKRIRPRIMIFLETELWPGLMAALKHSGCSMLIINARMSEKSFQHYMLWPAFWRQLKPNHILAITSADAGRFSRLFNTSAVDIISNIKFDRLSDTQGNAQTTHPLQDLLNPDSTFAVLASVRQEEEEDIQKIILTIRREYPRAIFGLVPRHHHRVESWKTILTRNAVPWVTRSTMNRPAADGTVIIWDTFGELLDVYQRAQAAFVGGSLAPLGGQNFMEALICGVIPVIGPSWKNFEWVGRDIVDAKLLQIASDWQDAAETLMTNLSSSTCRETVRRKALKFIRSRQGGVASACCLINRFLKHPPDLTEPNSSNGFHHA